MLAPLARRRVKAPPIAMQAVAFSAPVGLCVAVRRSRARDVAVCALQMWAYLAAYEAPHDDHERQTARTHIDYPIAVDRVLGLGQLPTERLQRRLARLGPDGPEWRTRDRVLVWAHWLWFLVPHTALTFIFLRRPLERFPRAAVLTYAVFDIGACFYWLLPTAPPWYAAQLGRPVAGSPGVDGVVELGANGAPGEAHGSEWPGDSMITPWGASLRETAAGGVRATGATSVSGASELGGVASGATTLAGGTMPTLGADRPAARGAHGSNGAGGMTPPDALPTLAVRRMMVEYGEHFWGEGWGPMFKALGGNPFAAMPSLHCATSVMAAILLTEAGPVPGAIGWSYAGVLGFALVYLGEHYVVDLLGGVALTGAVYRLGPVAAPAFARVGDAVRALEELAHGE